MIRSIQVIIFSLSVLAGGVIAADNAAAEQPVARLGGDAVPGDLWQPQMRYRFLERWQGGLPEVETIAKEARQFIEGEAQKFYLAQQWKGAESEDPEQVDEMDEIPSALKRQVEDILLLHRATIDARRAYMAEPLPEDVEPTDAEIQERIESWRAGGSDEPTVSFGFVMVPKPEEAAEAERLIKELQGLRGRAAESDRKLVAVFGESDVDFGEAAQADELAGVKPSTLLPDIRSALFEELEPGEVSQVIEMPRHFVVAHLLTRIVPSPVASERMIRRATNELRNERKTERLEEVRDEAMGEFPYEPLDYRGDLGALTALPPETHVIEVGNRSVNMKQWVELMLFERTWPLDIDGWEAAHRDLYELLIEAEALDRLEHEEIHPLQKIAQRWNTLNYLGFVTVADELGVDSEQNLEAAYEKLIELEARNPVVEYRALYIRPKQRADEERDVVPAEEVLVEIQRIRAEIEAGLDFEEAVARYSTDPVAGEDRGWRRVRRSEAGADLPIVDELRVFEAEGFMTSPVRLQDGFAIAVLEGRSDLEFPPMEEVMPWVKRQALLTFGGGAVRSSSEVAVEKLLEIDDEALVSWAERIRNEMKEAGIGRPDAAAGEDAGEPND